MERLCGYCNELFVPKRSDAQFCSHTCRQLAYVLRKAIKMPRANLNGLTLNPETSTKQDQINDKPEELTDNNEQVSIKAKEIQLYPSTTAEINVNENKKELSVNTDKEPELILNADSINETKAGKEKTEERYIDYESRFVRELIELTESRGYTEKLASLSYHGSVPAGWISLRYKCLVECLLTFSEMKEISVDDLKEICNSFTSIIQSNYFKSLPNSYPYKNEIAKLRNSIKLLCLDHEEAESLKFRFKHETKIQLIATRFELSQRVPKKRYSELDFNK